MGGGGGGGGVGLGVRRSSWFTPELSSTLSGDVEPVI